MSEKKPIHAKPSLYAMYFLQLKEIALKYGYNLVIHGSMNRDLDLVAIPWQEEIKGHLDMIMEMCHYLGGWIEGAEFGGKWYPCAVTHHGRMQYVINLNRGGKRTNYEDPQYYVDISVIPTADRIPPFEIVPEWTVEQQKYFINKQFDEDGN